MLYTTGSQMNPIDKAVGTGGRCTYKFAQKDAFQIADATQQYSKSHKDGNWNDQGKTYKMVLRGKTPGSQSEMGGVCATIAAFWIAFRSDQDIGSNASFTKGRSVWDYLFTHGGLNTGAAMNITVEHHMSSGDQLSYFEAFLNKFKLYKTHSSSFIESNSTTAYDVTAAAFEQNGYKLVQLKQTKNGSGNGHMVALYTVGHEVFFMDPNWGEFWFPDRKAFNLWLSRLWGYDYLRFKSVRFHTYTAG